MGDKRGKRKPFVRSRAAVLWHLLIREGKFSYVELRRLSNLPDSTLSRVLKYLVDVRILRKERNGRHTLYSIRNHLNADRMVDRYFATTNPSFKTFKKHVVLLKRLIDQLPSSARQLDKAKPHIKRIARAVNQVGLQSIFDFLADHPLMVDEPIGSELILGMLESPPRYCTECYERLRRVRIRPDPKDIQIVQRDGEYVCSGCGMVYS